MLERARASTSSEYALRYCADACCRRKSQMHAVFIVPIPRRSRSGEGDARLVALVRIFTHTYNVGKGANLGENAKSSAGASHCRPRASRVIKAERVTGNQRPKVPKVRERNSTSKIRLRRDGGTHHYNFPLSAREHNSKHVASPARKRKPPAPACLFRPPRGGGTRPSTSARGATAQLARRWGSPTSCY